MSSGADQLRRIARTWAINSFNAGAYAFSGGEETYHEGTYSQRFGKWCNWSRTFACQPAHYETPSTEENIRELVGSAKQVRVAGGGHTFNTSPLTDQTLLSLDQYKKILEVDFDKKTARVQAGIRLRDLTRHLQAHGLTLPVMGSTNAQSIAGLLATDLHGTGRDHGFLSEQVLSLRIVNARGEVETVHPGHPIFHAAIGGLGCCGVVTEVELQCVDAYNLEKSLQIVPRVWAETNIAELLREHRHLSFYYIGGADVENVRMNLWNETPKKTLASACWRDPYGELIDMLFSGYLLGLTRLMKSTALTSWAGLAFFKCTMHGRKTVYPSALGFRRRLYYHHDELEYGVPFETYRACLQEILDLLQREKHPAIVEVRFTPDSSQGLLGPGVGRRTCYIEVAPSLSYDTTTLFQQAEQILLRYHGQVHLGKATWVTPDIMQTMFGERFTRFQSARRQQDSEGKFDNPFTRQVFGPLPAEKPFG